MAVDISHVKDVAIYLRKSRGDEDDLSKHREELIELCNKNNWRYVEYAEVASSQKLDERPELMKLLKEVEDGMYDAIVVIDKDRLSREGLGQAQINKILAENECLIITPQRVYDLSDDSDMLMSEVEDLMARFEYRMIRKRLRRGKKRGAKRGEWTNGIPPLPYVYNPEKKGLEVDEEKLPIYRFIVEEFINGNSPYNIAWELNKMKIPSPRGGGLWKDVTVRRLLLDETHLGRIIANKTEKWTKKNGKLKYIVNPRENWIIVENCHKAVKTKEEHEKILLEFEKRRRNYTYAKSGTFPLTGLVKCGKCGRSMSFQRKPNGNHLIKKCQYFKEDGVTRCGNEGGETKIILDEIRRQLYKYKEYIENQRERAKKENSLYSNIQREITKKENKIEELNEQLEQVTKLALAKFFTPDEAVAQKTKILNEIKQLEDEINLLNIQYNNFENMTNQDRINAIDELFAILDDESAPIYQINRAFKKIIDSIIWIREGDKVEITINFL